MNDADFDVSSITEAYQTPLTRFARNLRELAGDNLLGLSAFGGCVTGDAFYAQAPARSVAVLDHVDLEMLDRLASEGAHFGQRGVSAPLIMTPDYIRDSCDTFPLELLEIQQLHALVWGQDHFADLTFDHRDLRLQCERELKSELIQLRQGLLSVAGRHKALYDLCLACSERSIRVLRGVLHLTDDQPPPRLIHEIVARAAQATGVCLDALKNMLAGDAHSSLTAFACFYGEVEALARHVDALGDGAAR
jgi:hypothetical protein